MVVVAIVTEYDNRLDRMPFVYALLEFHTLFLTLLIKVNAMKPYNISNESFFLMLKDDVISSKKN